MEQNTAKHFALQLGSLISLYVSLSALITLLFGVITITYPDAAYSYEYESASSGIRFGIALLAVFFPAYIVLTRIINKGRRETGTPYLGVTKWLIYLSLLVGGVVLLGDLVAVINSFLNGELTTRFLLKALTVLVVIGSAFTYYLYDARGYWHANESKSKLYGLGALILVLVALVLGYQKIEAPSEVREQALDERQIQDLGLMQSYILSHYTIASSLPASLGELEMRESLPVPPDMRQPYTYAKKSDTSFELCATFAFASDPNRYAYPMYDMGGGIVKNPDDWNHEKGTWCFTRVLNQPVMNAQVIK
jgi:Domain of unknown function (DUF5671)